MSRPSDAQSRAYYDDFSRGYERGRSRGYHALIDDLELDVVLPLCEGRSVLEVGCGTGLILERLAQRAQYACGVDLSSGMLRMARDRGLEGVLGSATALPFADESFDLVCSFKVLAHVPDIGSALAEIARVTKPGGQMVLEFYNPWSLRYAAKRLAGPQPISDGRTEADVYTRWDSPRAIEHWLPTGVELEGFRGVRVVTPAAFVHRIPVVAPVLAAVERVALDSPLRYFGGFLIALLRKR
ncbi:MAG: methyltransferase domain-containing protein [Myxococcales bacterium]|nr:methyltransferase domain-containing protein [Myxococcales bacterium]